MSKGQKVPTLSQKRLTLNGGNFSLLAPKLMRFFQKTGIWKIFLFNCTIFHEQFFVLTKRSWNVLLKRDFDSLFRSFKFKYRLSFSSFCSKHLTSNRCISGLPCPIAMRFLSSESTFQAPTFNHNIWSNQNNAKGREAKLNVATF